jgi:GNAT superfamily N-acetyltransferase
VNPIRFRAAGPGDVPAVVALVESAYRGDVSRAGWTTEADLLDGQRTDPGEVATLITRAGSRVLLAEDPATGSGRGSASGAGQGGALLACCHIERENAQRCYFGMFAVRPGEQGRGLGRALLAEAERIARMEWGCTMMAMTVIDVRAELIAWYERRGYHRTGEYKAFPYGDPRFGLPRRDDLRFETLEKPLHAKVTA